MDSKITSINFSFSVWLVEKPNIIRLIGIGNTINGSIETTTTIYVDHDHHHGSNINKSLPEHYFKIELFFCAGFAEWQTC